MSDAFYSGFWINYGKGSVTGLTLTVSTRSGGLFISFLTMFVRLTGSHLWSIIRFILHQCRSTCEPRDALYHQQQATLRNGSSQTQTLWKMALLTWFWRSTADKTLRRSLPIMTLVTFHFVAFTIAGLFTSRIVASSSEALLRSGTCGYWYYEGFARNQSALDEARTAITRYNFGVASESLNYANNCYGPESAGGDCDIFSQRKISTLINTSAPCLFSDSKTCWSQRSNIEIDTGVIDSNRDLGINAPSDSRVGYRKVTSCAPFNQTKWSTFVRGKADTFPGERSMYYNLGPRIYFNSSMNKSYTYSVSEYAGVFRQNAYHLEVAESPLNAPLNLSISTFRPDSTFFTQTDEDFLVVFLTSWSQYIQPVLDQWFYAKSTVGDTSVEDGYLYETSELASTLACSEKHQFCNLNKNSAGEHRCTALTGRFALQNTLYGNDSSELEMNARQRAITLRLLYNVDEFSLASIVRKFDATTLKARNYLLSHGTGLSFLSEGLPSDQWKQEVVNWHDITMINLQRWANTEVAGPKNPEYRKYIRSPQSREWEWMCGNQRFRPNNAMSFNGLGVILLLVFGSIIIFINLALSTITAHVQTSLNKGIHRCKEWILDDTFQLQRIAFEGSSQGHWRGKEDMVPVTQRGEKLFALPLVMHSGSAVNYRYVSLKDRKSWRGDGNEFI